MTVEEDIKLFENSKKNSEYFKSQINLIKDESLKNWLIHFLDNKIGTFEIEKPTSSSGKYHPENQNLKAGNGRHTKSLIKFLEIFKNSRPDLDWDCMFTAGILHDMKKYKTKNSEHTDKNHPLKMSLDILQDAKDNYKFTFKKLFHKGLKDTINDVKLYNKLKYIASLVRWHMGRFDKDNANKEQIEKEYVDKAKDNLYNEEHWIFHYCDALATAKWIGTEETF